MKFFDISTDTKSLYQLKKNEKTVFFMLNRSGEITFDMNESGGEAHIFSFFLLSGPEPQTLKLIQKHRAPRTSSQALVKAALAGQGSLAYEGLIHIEQSGNLSEAFQESRALLLSKDAHMFTKPALEILAPDVRCHHAATSSPLNPDSLFYIRSRGLGEKEGRELLLRGFFNEALEKMEVLGAQRVPVEKQLLPLLQTLC